MNWLAMGRSGATLASAYPAASEPSQGPIPQCAALRSAEPGYQRPTLTVCDLTRPRFIQNSGRVFISASNKVENKGAETGKAKTRIHIPLQHIKREVISPDEGPNG